MVTWPRCMYNLSNEGRCHSSTLSGMSELTNAVSYSDYCLYLYFMWHRGRLALKDGRG